MIAYLRIAAIGAVLATATTTAHAATGIVSFTGGSSFQSFDSTNMTIGFTFSTANAINVTSLGWYAASGTVTQAHQVGLWTTGGTLLGSVTVTPGATGAGNFRFASLPTVALAAGQYLIGGTVNTPFDDRYQTSTSDLVTGTGITLLGTARSNSNSGFAAPSITGAGNGRFGPNFEYTVAGAPGVPEPASWALMIGGFGLVGTALRTRRRSVAA